MMKTHNIRKCTVEDVELVGKFYDDFVSWLDCHINYPRWIYKVYPSESSVRAMTEAGDQYVCLDGEKITGAFALSTEVQGSYQKANWSRHLDDGTYVVIHALATDPEMQRQGIGTGVIRYCIDKAKAEGYKAIRVDIAPGNIPARSLFEKAGFDYAGDVDLELPIGDIPAFSMYELNF